ncbi:2-oxo-hept-4-ene-1,7-dioate hydratase [Glutamicibacter uratoxydans]|uniref:2-oxo-hept-4-ene-1,7-dioate hydratase n=1 Tax=Glutamicibacter uratoxydans TaxID=43667 RepID=UPI003D6EA66C
MLSQQTIQSIAERLEQAELTKVPMTQLSVQYPGMSIDEAYAIQTAWRELKLAKGRKLSGRKIGLTSRTMQKAQEVDEPDRGFFLDDMMYADSAVIDHSKFIKPRVEVEIVFILKRDLSGPNVTLTDVLDATAWVQPGLEILDARLEMRDPKSGQARKIVDAIGDNAANGGMILGGNPQKISKVDLRWESAMLYVNGTIEESGVSGAVMNHPAASVAWLANSLAPYGEKLEAGLPILSGSFTRPVFVHSGDTLQAEYQNLGTVTAYFE